MINREEGLQKGWRERRSAISERLKQQKANTGCGAGVGKSYTKILWAAEGIHIHCSNFLGLKVKKNDQNIFPN